MITLDASAIASPAISFSWTSSGGTMPSINTLNSKLLLAASTYSATGSSVGVSDFLGNIFVPMPERISAAGSGNVKVRMWYVSNPIGSATHFTQFFGLNSFPTGMILSFRGVKDSPFEAEDGSANGNNTSLQCGSVNATENNELFITVASITNNALFNNIDSGFTIVFNNNGVPGSCFTAGLAIKNRAFPGIESPTWNWTGLAGGVTSIAAFKAIVDPDFSFGVDAKKV